MAMLFFVQYAGPSVFGFESGMDADGKYPTQHYTMVFNTFVLCQLFNEINARKLRGEWNVFSVWAEYAVRYICGKFFMIQIVKVEPGYNNTVRGGNTDRCMLTLQGIFTNMYFVVIMVAQLAFQILIVEFGGRVFMTTALSWEQWGWCLLMGSGELVWNQIINVVPVMIPRVRKSEICTVACTDGSSLNKATSVAKDWR